MEEKEIGITYLLGEEGFATPKTDTSCIEGFYDSYVKMVDKADQELSKVYQEVSTLAATTTNQFDEEREQQSSFQEVKDAVSYIESDIETLSTMTASVLTAYKDMAGMIDSLRQGEFKEAYIRHRESELIKQNQGFNVLFGYFNTYIMKAISFLEKVQNWLDVSTKEQVSEEERQDILDQYTHLLGLRKNINKELEARMLFMNSVIKFLREDVAKLELSRLEQDILDRKRKLQASKYTETVEDVKDYTDLEGQYRHRFDEKGNLVETETGGEGGDKGGLKAIFIVTFLVLIVLVALFYYK